MLLEDDEFYPKSDGLYAEPDEISDKSDEFILKKCWI